MTNAELIQSEIENKENGSDNGKAKSRPSKKKSKGKAKATELVEQSDSSELVSSEDTLDVSKVDSVNKEVDFFQVEGDEEEEDDDESTEFNAIFFLMSAPNRLKLR